MAKRDYIIIEIMSCVYKLTKNKWKAYLKDKISGKDINIESYGRFLGYLEGNITDWDEQEYIDVLDGIENPHVLKPVDQESALRSMRRKLPGGQG